MRRVKAPRHKGGIKRTAMKPHRAKEEPGKKDAIVTWRTAVLGAVDSKLDPHHALPRRWLLQYAKRQGLRGPAFWAVVYDPRIGVPLHPETHRLHTQRIDVIPASVLPQSVIDAANEYGPEAVAALEREHPEVWS